MLINRIINFAAILFVIRLLSVYVLTIPLELSILNSTELMINPDRRPSLQLDRSWPTALIIADDHQPVSKPMATVAATGRLRLGQLNSMKSHPNSNSDSLYHRINQIMNNSQLPVYRTGNFDQHFDGKDDIKLNYLKRLKRKINDHYLNERSSTKSMDDPSHNIPDINISINNDNNNNNNNDNINDNTNHNDTASHSRYHNNPITIKLKYSDPRVFELYNRCSDGYLYVNPATNTIGANWRHNGDSYIRFVDSRFGGFAIYFYRQKKFLCIDSENASVVAKDCFDWCSCSFQEEVGNDYLLYHLDSNKNWKLTVNSMGVPISFFDARYRRVNYLTCRQWIKTDVENETIWQHPMNYAEDRSCDDWKLTGEKIFNRAIKKDPNLDCLLSRHSVQTLSTGKRTRKKQKRTKFRHRNRSKSKAVQLQTPLQAQSYTYSTEIPKDLCQPEGETDVRTKRIRHLPKKIQHRCQ